MTSKEGRGGAAIPALRFYRAWCDHGGDRLNSERAVEMSVFVVRAFVRLREMLATNRKLAGKICELEDRLDTHDSTIQDLIDAIKELMTPEGPAAPAHRISAACRA